MAEEISLDMSKISKRRLRSKRDITRFWHTRYGAFLKDGFDDEEAKWGADNGLSLKNSTVKQVRSHRRALIRYYMRHDNTRMRAIELAVSDLDQTLEMYGIKEKNIFYEVYTKWD